MASPYTAEALEEFRRTGIPHDSMMRLSPLKCQRRWLATVDELRAELEVANAADYRQGWRSETAYCKELKRLKEENARLVGALEAIIRGAPETQPDMNTPARAALIGTEAWHAGMNWAEYHAAECARAAIAKGQDDDR